MSKEFFPPRPTIYAYTGGNPLYSGMYKEAYNE